MNTIITKSDNIWKIKNRTKKIIYAKNERHINSNLTCRFGYFWNFFNFWAPKTPLMDTRSAQTRYDATLNFIFSILRIFYVKMATSEGPSVLVKQPRSGRPFPDPSEQGFYSDWQKKNNLSRFCENDKWKTIKVLAFLAVIFRFLVFEIWSILYLKFIVNWDFRDFCEPNLETLTSDTR